MSLNWLKPSMPFRTMFVIIVVSLAAHIHFLRIPGEADHHSGAKPITIPA